MSTNLDFGAVPVINKIVDGSDADVDSDDDASENVAENWEDLLEDDEAGPNKPADSKPQTESERNKLKMNEIIENEDMKAAADLFSDSHTKDEKGNGKESPVYEFVDEFISKLESYKNNPTESDLVCRKLFAGLFSIYSVQNHKKIEKILQNELSAALRKAQKSATHTKKGPNTPASATKAPAAQAAKPAQKKSLNTGASRKKNTKGWDMDLVADDDDQDDYYDDN